MKLAISIFALLLLALGAHAQSPMHEVKAATEKVMLLLNDPKMQGESKKDERRQLVRSEMEKRIDWEASARLCLGTHWVNRTAEERAEYVRVFSEFLKARYADKIEANFKDLDKVGYQSEQMIDNWASVTLVMTTKGRIDRTIEYCMEKAPSGGEWKINDVILEGVSLVKIYRDQLDVIISKSSYEGLLKEIKSRLAAAPTVQ